FVDDGVAIAPGRAKDVPHQAMRVHANEGRSVAADVALHECNVRFAVDLALVGDHLEFAVARRQDRFGDPLDISFMSHPVADQLSDREHLEVVLGAELDQIGDAAHRAVVIHDLADHACGKQSCHAREVDGSFRLPCAYEYATFLCTQREGVPGPYE